jgi:hypothetical protein
VSTLGAIGVGLLAGWLACSPLVAAARSRRLDWALKSTIFAAALGGSAAGFSYLYAATNGLLAATVGAALGLLLRAFVLLWAGRERQTY